LYSLGWGICTAAISDNSISTGGIWEVP